LTAVNQNVPPKLSAHFNSCGCSTKWTLVQLRLNDIQSAYKDILRRSTMSNRLSTHTIPNSRLGQLTPI